MRASASGDTPPVGQTIIDKLSQFRLAARSLARKEIGRPRRLERRWPLLAGSPAVGLFALPR
jgi:hypothetical protein